MNLISPPVRSTHIEETTLALFAEWLSQWFDGQPHEISSDYRESPPKPIVFPQAELRYGVSQLSQPLGDKLGISMVWMQYGPKRQSWISATADADGVRSWREITIQATWHFFVRAGTSGTVTGEERVMLGASLLHHLLENPLAWGPLAEKGVHHLRPNHPTQISQADYATRLVSCRGTIRYPL
jgi:hypothetical protein